MVRMGLTQQSMKRLQNHSITEAGRDSCRLSSHKPCPKQCQQFFLPGQNPWSVFKKAQLWEFWVGRSMEQATTVVYQIQQDFSLFPSSLMLVFILSLQLITTLVLDYFHSFCTTLTERVLTGASRCTITGGVVQSTSRQSWSPLGLDGCLQRREVLNTECSDKCRYLP